MWFTFKRGWINIVCHWLVALPAVHARWFAAIGRRELVAIAEAGGTVSARGARRSWVVLSLLPRLTSVCWQTHRSPTLGLLSHDMSGVNTWQIGVNIVWHLGEHMTLWDEHMIHQGEHNKWQTQHDLHDHQRTWHMITEHTTHLSEQTRVNTWHIRLSTWQ